MEAAHGHDLVRPSIDQCLADVIACLDVVWPYEGHVLGIIRITGLHTGPAVWDHYGDTRFFGHLQQFWSYLGCLRNNDQTVNTCCDQALQVGNLLVLAVLHVDNLELDVQLSGDLFHETDVAYPEGIRQSRHLHTYCKPLLMAVRSYVEGPHSGQDETCNYQQRENHHKP